MTEKILLAAPVSQHKEYVLPAWIKHIKQIEGVAEILLVDNSQNGLYHLELIDRRVNVHHIPAHKHDIGTLLTLSQNHIRDYVLKNNFTHWFSLECDVFPPLDVVQILANYHRPIISGCYFSGTPDDTYFMQYRHSQLLPGQYYQENIHLNEVFFMYDGQARRVHHPALGCTLIHRNVLEKTKFEYPQQGKVESDSLFFAACFKNKIPVYSHFGIMCEHRNSNWSKIIQLHNYGIK
jgi:hypothetical protein